MKWKLIGIAVLLLLSGCSDPSGGAGPWSPRGGEDADVADREDWALPCLKWDEEGRRLFVLSPEIGGLT